MYWLYNCREIARDLNFIPIRFFRKGSWKQESSQWFNNSPKYYDTRVSSKPQITSRDLSNLTKDSIISKMETTNFMAVFPDIVRNLTDTEQDTDLAAAFKRFAEVLHYNVSDGKKQRALTMISAYKMLEKPENLTPEKIRLAYILGWCTEMFQSYCIIMDDIIDQSETRRGRLCWYKKEGNGLNAINDGLLVENGIYEILRRYLSGHPSYIAIVEFFLEVTLKTSMGEIQDILATYQSDGNLTMLTMKTYDSIIKYKAGYATFHLPIGLAMYLANYNDKELHGQTENILLEMGKFFQVQDDFLDCFGDPAKTGKIGSDIKEGKCSWLAVTALERANPAQRQVMEEHYGKDNPESIQLIRDLYESLNLPKIYAVYEEESYNQIRSEIEKISKDLLQGLLFKILAHTYKRDR